MHTVLISALKINSREVEMKSTSVVAASGQPSNRNWKAVHRDRVYSNQSY